MHRVLEQAWTSRESSRRKVRCPRILVTRRVPDPLVIEPEVIRDHEQLVRDRELEISPAVAEQLREFSFLGTDVLRFVRQMPE